MNDLIKSLINWQKRKNRINFTNTNFNLFCIQSNCYTTVSRGFTYSLIFPIVNL